MRSKYRTDPLPPPGGAAELVGLASGLSTLRRVDSGERVVALTFDDGPDATYTPAKLRTLKEHRASATFFVLGKLVNQLPEVTGLILSGGGEIGNHSYDHPYLTGLGYSQVLSQLEQTRAAVRQATGRGGTTLFRPPYGDYNASVLSAAAEAGYTYNVLWDVDPSDYSSPPAWAITNHVLANVVPGSIVILHDWVRSTAEALPDILSGLSARGYRAVTVSTLLGTASPLLPEPPGPPYRPAQCRVLAVRTPYLRGGDVLAVQESLRHRGYAPGPGDGVYGPRTENAVRAFQTAQGLPVTGVVTGEVYRRLEVICPDYPSDPSPPASPEPSEPEGCRTLQVQSPLQEGPDVLQVQQALAVLGHDPGPLDGIYGTRTSDAVRRFQVVKGLPVTGVVTAEVYRGLGIPCP